jgi:hypothetical protein
VAPIAKCGVPFTKFSHSFRVAPAPWPGYSYATSNFILEATWDSLLELGSLAALPTPSWLRILLVALELLSKGEAPLISPLRCHSSAIGSAVAVSAALLRA